MFGGRSLVFVSLVALLLACQLVQGKVVDGTVTVVEEEMPQALTKFSFWPTDSSSDKSVIQGWMKYSGSNSNAKLYLFMDNKWWDHFHNSDLDPCDKMNEASAIISVGKEDGLLEGGGIGKAVMVEKEKVGRRETQWHFKWEVHHAVRTYGWYVVLGDCPLNGESRSAGNAARNRRRTSRKAKQRIDYHLELLNPGGSHLPADEWGLTTVYSFVFLLMSGFGYQSWKRSQANSLGNSTHFVVRLFAAAYVLQYLSVIFELLHLFKYSSDGYGSFFIDFLSEVCEGMSQTTLSFLLICLASGWTLTSSSSNGGGIGGILRDPQSLVRPDSPAMAFMFAFTVLLMILQFFNKWQDDNFLKFHDHESTVGKILVLMRFLFAILYIRSLNATLQQQHNSGGVNLISFLRKLQAYGTLWFISFPLLVFFAGFFAHYLRHRVVTGGVLVLQTACLFALAEQFLSESSSYFRISSISSYAFLPGGHFMGGFGGKDKAF